MTPSDLRQHLAAFADGELDPDCTARIEALLDQQPVLRAEVERWRALRRAARRSITDEPIPAGLPERVQDALRRAGAPRKIVLRRWLWIGLPGTVVAAAVVIALLVWPLAGATVPVEASALARIHRRCAVSHRHDSFEVRGSAAGAGYAKIRQKATFACKLPDLSACGRFELDGACRCSPSRDLKVVHAYFRCADEPSRVVSVFATDRPVKLNVGGAACPACKCGCRAYRSGQDGDVTLIGWRDGKHGYVVAGRMKEPELLRLADGITVAELRQLDRAAQIYLASATQP